jgi:hypothetical protein
MATVLTGLADVAAALRIIEPNADPENIGTAVRHWLEVNGKRALLVFDNATDLVSLAPFLPTAGQAHVIITSTQRKADGLGTVVQTPVFTEAEALAFLAQRTGREDATGARELAAELGFLPLALAQAAAVIAAQHLDYPTYLARLYLARLHTVPVREILKRAREEPYPLDATKTIRQALEAVAA